MRLIRSFLLAAALLAFLVLALVANVGVWSLSTLVDSQAFAATTNRIIAQPEVRSLLADRLAVRLTELLVPASGRVSTVVRVPLGLAREATSDDVRVALAEVIDATLAQPGVVAIQQGALEELHRAVLDLIGGRDVAGERDAAILLDLDAVVSAVAEQLDPGGTGFLGQVVPTGLGTLTVVDSERLTTLAGALHLMDALRWLLPALCLLFAALVLLLARARLHAVAWLGLCLLLVGAFCLLATTAAPTVAGRLFGTHPDAAASMSTTLDGLTAGLVTQSAVLAGLGLAMLVVGITAGIVISHGDGRRHLDGYA
ncbi:MAG: hypothetical protein LH650_02070 [Chloroflexi bacterium]|nr:hypothetical protein [Chloroflexota bacterium]